MARVRRHYLPDTSGTSPIVATKRSFCSNFPRIVSGSKEFVDKVKLKMGILTKGRDVRKTNAGYQLREPVNSSMNHFEAEKSDIGCENG